MIRGTTGASPGTLAEILAYASPCASRASKTACTRLRTVGSREPVWSRAPNLVAYKSVTFLSIDADENPVIVGENSISAFPTFKFFLNSAEEDLPIVGAEISDVQSKIDELMEANGLS